MGAYLAQPITQKESSSGAGPGHGWGCSCLQGWRSSMEDAHLTLSDLGGETGAGLALFAVFDGHGGREVAQFCREHVAEQVRRQLGRLGAGAAEGAPGAPVVRAARLGEALRESFHAVDDMLRLPEYEKELFALKQGAGGSCPSTPGAGRGGGDAGEGTGAAEPKVVTFLSDSIQADLSQARDRGSISTEEATQVMMKMAMLKRLKAQHGLTGDPADGNGDGRRGCAADNVGCTAVCILLSEHEAVCANAGDSRALLCRGGRAVELSRDHKPNDERERRRIEAAGGRVEEIPVGQRVHYRVNGNLNLSRAIGDMEFKRRPDLGPEAQVISATPDIVALPLTEDDEFIVLACDGVWDVKSSQEVCDFVGSRLKAGEAITRIVEDLLDDCVADDPKEAQGLGADNMTCVVVQLLPRGGQCDKSP